MPASISDRNVVALIPFLYADVPRIMSFSTWPMTLRQNRVDTFPLTPVGSDALSGRWVATTRITPNAGPILITNSASAQAGLPCCDRVQPQRPLSGDLRSELTRCPVQ
jgi:hypothetical protein